MATEIKLKVKQEIDGEIVTKNPTFEIEKLNFFKFIGVSKTINDIIGTAKQDEELVAVFKQMFNAEPVEDESAEEKAEKDQAFMGKLVASFETIVVKLPEKALTLLSQLSGIDEQVLGNQDFSVILDVYDAVLAENDIQELVERVKKSSGLTKSAFKLKALVSNAAQ
jgi:hypothetical protein